MKYYKPRNLLTVNNSKTIKGEKFGWKTYILYMAPHTQNSSGKNLCSHASAGCISACLYTSGHGGIQPSVPKGRMNKADYFIQGKTEFFTQLVKELTKISIKNEGNTEEKICVRLNGTTDVTWEKMFVKDGKTIFDLFPSIQFYDYTKKAFRLRRELPSNYHLTFSKSEANTEESFKLLSEGKNVAFVFDKVPETYMGYKVINGDESDLRFEDEKNVIVGLKYKKSTKKGADNEQAFKSGFAIRTIEIEQVQEVVAQLKEVA